MARELLEALSTGFIEVFEVDPTVVIGAVVATIAQTQVSLTVTFDGSASHSPNGNITAYSWDFGDNTQLSTATTARPVHTYSAAGSYLVTLAVTDSIGQTGTTTIAIHLTAPVTSGGDGNTNTGSGSGTTTGGVEPTGSGIVSISTLSGSTFNAKMNAAGLAKMVSLPTGTFSFSDFTFGTSPTLMGADISTAGMLGAGVDQSIVEMVKGSSTRASLVPTASGTTNQLQLIRFNQSTGATDTTTTGGGTTGGGGGGGTSSGTKPSSATTGVGLIAQIADQGTVHTVTAASAAALATATSAASSGDTVKLLAGTYSGVGSSHFKAGVLYKGVIGATIITPSSQFAMGSMSAMKMDGLKWTGHGFTTSSGTAPVFQNCTFSLTNSDSNGINLQGLTNPLFQYCEFTGVIPNQPVVNLTGSGSGAHFYRCYFHDTTQHISIRNQSAFRFEECYQTTWTRMAMEDFGGGQSSHVLINNVVENPTSYTQPCWSLVLEDGSTNTQHLLAGNYFTGSTTAARTACAIELSGAWYCTGNTIYGFAGGYACSKINGTYINGDTISKPQSYGYFSSEPYQGAQPNGAGAVIGTNILDGTSVTGSKGLLSASTSGSPSSTALGLVTAAGWHAIGTGASTTSSTTTTTTTTSTTTTTTAVSAGVKLDGFTLQATDQGHTYNGLELYYITSGVSVSNVKVVGIPGLTNYPPGETFAINAFHCTTPTFQNVEIDGASVTASGIATNSCTGGTVINTCYAHDLKYSSGIALWEQTGNVSITKFRAINNYGGMSFERCAGSITITAPTFSGSTDHDIYIGNDQNSSVVTITDPVLDSGKKLVIRINSTEQSNAQLQKKSDIHVLVGGVDQTSTLVSFVGTYTGT